MDREFTDLDVADASANDDDELLNDDDTSSLSDDRADSLEENRLIHCRLDRLRRIAEYQTFSLAKEDPLAACLGAHNGALMGMAVGLEGVLNPSLANGPATVEHIQKMSPAIDTYLRVTRQVDRFSQMERRSDESRKPVGILGPSAGVEALKGLARDAKRRSSGLIPKSW